MIQLKYETLSKIRKNKQLKRALMDYLDISPATMYNYLGANSPVLTQFGVLKVIGAYLKEDYNNLIEEL